MIVSQLAGEDLADLRSEGLKPTDEDVIRLHALALRISSGEDFSAVNLPRYSVVGNTVFHEPTVAARIWFRNSAKFAMNDEMENWLFAFASANGRRVGYLEDLVTGEAIEKEIGKFIGSFHGTYEEMVRAVAYAAYGCGEVVAERTELAKKRFDEAQRWETSTDRERSNLAQLEAMIDRAAACTGLTMAEIKAQPISRLSAMIYFAHVKAGIQIDSSAARLHAEYLATLRSIRKRLENERADELTKSQVVEK